MSLYHVPCPSSLDLGSPAVVSMSSPLSTKDKESEEVHPPHCIFISLDSDEMVSQRKTKPLGAGESCCWVSQAQGLLVARSATVAQTLASHLRGQPLDSPCDWACINRLALPCYGPLTASWTWSISAAPAQKWVTLTVQCGSCGCTESSEWHCKHLSALWPQCIFSTFISIKSCPSRLYCRTPFQWEWLLNMIMLLHWGSQFPPSHLRRGIPAF